MINTNGSVSILLVDDDEINNFISIKLIKKALLNTDIMACLHGKYAIDLLLDIQRNDPSKLPDYILLDINMPIMNGWEFLDEYTRLNIDPLAKCKVYIISSSSTSKMLTEPLVLIICNFIRRQNLKSFVSI